MKLLSVSAVMGSRNLFQLKVENNNKVNTRYYIKTKDDNLEQFCFRNNISMKEYN